MVLAALSVVVVGACRAAPPPAPDPPPLATHQPNAYKVDAIELYLMPMQRVEYKYQLATGATMIYSWTADKPIYYDMHNVPEGKPLTASVRIEEGTATQAHGVYTAPYPGIHGWFWENRQTEPVTIMLKTAGFYTQGIMISEGEQTPMPLQDPPPPIN
jgi:hypothetical protein